MPDSNTLLYFTYAGAQLRKLKADYAGEEAEPVTCGCCLEFDGYISNPKELPCGHTFCKNCLKDNQEDSNVIVCFDCKMQFDGSLEDLPSAVRGKEVCDICETETIAAAYCARCNKRYCALHKQMHQELHNSHPILSIQEYLKSSYSQEVRFCVKHKEQVLSLACNKCCLVKCHCCTEENSDCSKGGKHQFESIEKVAEEVKATVETQAEVKGKKLYEHSLLMMEIRKTVIHWDLRTDMGVQKIRKAREEQFAALETQYRKLEHDYVTLRESAKEVMDIYINEKTEERITESWGQLEDLIKLSASLTDKHDVDLLEAAHDIEIKMGELTKDELPHFDVKKHLSETKKLLKTGDEGSRKIEMCLQSTEVVASTNRTKERSFQITSDQVDEQIIVNYEEVPPFSSLVSEESAEQGTPSYTSHFDINESRQGDKLKGEEGQKTVQCTDLRNQPRLQEDEMYISDCHIELLQRLSAHSAEVSPPQPYCTTCTLISVTDHTEDDTYHVLMLATGHNQSVMGYENETDSYSWEISTVHSKQPKIYSLLLKSIKDSRQLSPSCTTPYYVLTNPEDFDQSMDGNFSAKPDLLSENHQSPGNITFKHRGLQIQISKENSCIEFSLESQKEKGTMDFVIGHYDLDQADCYEFHDSDSSAEETTSSCDWGLCDSLDIPDDSLIVTVVSMKSRKPEETEDCLYHLVAGPLQEDTKGSFENWEAVTTELTNDWLHREIQLTCQRDLYSQLNPDEQQKLRENTPCFIVTEELPTDQEEVQSIKPKLSEENGRRTYTCFHPRNIEMFVRVYEPASPSDCEYGAVGGEMLSSNLMLSSFPEKKLELEREQERVYHLLRSYDHTGLQPVNPRHTITIIISTTLEVSGVKSVVFILRGIIIDFDSKNLFRLEGKFSQGGWLTTTHWMTSSSMVSKLDERWNFVTSRLNDRNQQGVHRGLREQQFGLINLPSLENKSLEISVPQPENITPQGDIHMVSPHAEMLFHSKHNVQDRQTSAHPRQRTTNKPQPHFLLKTTRQQNMGDAGAQKYRRVEAKCLQQLSRTEPDVNSLKDRLLVCLRRQHRPVADRSTSTISVHKVHTKVYRGKTNLHVNTDEQTVRSNFFIVAKGTPTDVVLPEVKYNDPLNSWGSASGTVEDAHLDSALECNWSTACERAPTDPEKCFTGDMAQFGIFLQKEDEETFEPQGLELKGIFARKRKVNCKNSSLIHVWSHSARIDALYCHLMDTDTGRTDLDNMLDQYTKWPEQRRAALMEEECIKRFITHHKLDDPDHLPLSFQHSTMQIQHCILPVINQVGFQPCKKDGNSNRVGSVFGCLVRDNDNKAHLKAARCGQQPRKLNGDSMRKLLQHHKTQRDKRDSNRQAAH